MAALNVSVGKVTAIAFVIAPFSSQLPIVQGLQIGHSSTNDFPRFVSSVSRKKDLI